MRVYGKPKILNPYLTLAGHAVFWLVIASLIGLWLALSLLVPGLSRGVAGLGFGRLVPVHTNLLLYGWCSLPLVALLFRFFQVERSVVVTKRAVWAVRLWSSALAVGAGSWVLGVSGGKLFLEWRGFSLVWLCLAMVFLWFVLWSARPTLGRSGRLIRLALLSCLAGIPAILFYAALPQAYPPVNPHSGGATGTSLFGSTLGLVFLFLMVPRLLLEAKDPSRDDGLPKLLVVFGGYVLYLALLKKGNVGNEEWSQILALLSLSVWVPLLWRYFGRYRLEKAMKPWAVAFLVWGALLWLDGWLIFLPGFLEAGKFSNSLVAHAHLAMAGMLSSFCVMVLIKVTEGRFRTLGGTYWSYHIGLAMQLVVLTLCGVYEADDPGFDFNGSTGLSVFYGLRFGGGLLMFLASFGWLFDLVRAGRAKEKVSQRGMEPLGVSITGTGLTAQSRPAESTLPKTIARGVATGHSWGPELW